MIAIMNLYRSPDLNGEFLMVPLKTYHKFFITKIAQNSGLKKLAWVVAYLVSGIFAYPVLGLLTCIGFAIKLTNIPELRRHNESIKRVIKSVQTSIHLTKRYTTLSSDSIVQSGYEMKTLAEYDMSADNCEDLRREINQRINEFSREFRKIYIARIGDVNRGEGEIRILLNVSEPISS